MNCWLNTLKYDDELNMKNCEMIWDEEDGTLKVGYAQQTTWHPNSHHIWVHAQIMKEAYQLRMICLKFTIVNWIAGKGRIRTHFIHHCLFLRSNCLTKDAPFLSDVCAAYVHPSVHFKNLANTYLMLLLNQGAREKNNIYRESHTVKFYLCFVKKPG